MFSFAFLDTILICVGAFCLVQILQRRRSNSLPLPPGPSGWPLLGNLLEHPLERAWETYAKWAEQYGSIFSLSILGQRLVIVNDVETAIGVLEKTGGKVAGRAKTTMLKISGWDVVLIAQPYGPSSRAYRKLIFKLIGTPQAMKRFHPMEERRSTVFVSSLLQSHDNVEEACRMMAGSVSLEAAFGYLVQDAGQDHFVELAEKCMADFSRLMRPGLFLADIIPALRYVPAWFPGAGFQKEVALAKKRIHDLAELPVKFVQEQLATDSRVPSLVGDMMAEGNLSEDEFQTMKYAALSFYAGAADTSVGTLLAYFIAMMRYPKVQEKLQAEIDSVVGNRFPTFEDRGSLPYSEAVMKELFRWIPVVPGGAPHLACEDVIYKGHVIPKGAFVLPNIWAMLRDPETYQNPLVFNPDRFLGSEPERDPATICFGFGRRSCPGFRLADATIWISIVKIAYACRVVKPIGKDGLPIEPEVAQTGGIVSHPVPFQCKIEARNPEIITKLIREALEH
jgi:cytochrome P450